jgi:polar amino acid transport system substrate-binding protein
MRNARLDLRRYCVALVLGILATMLRDGDVSAADPVISIVFDVNPNPPYFYGVGTAIDPDRPGLAVELLRLAGRRAGVSVSFARVPWQRGLYMLENGLADATFFSSYRQERLGFGVYPMKDGRPDTARAMMAQAYRLYVRRESGVTWDGTRVTGLRQPVGATPGFAVAAFLRGLGVAVAEEPSHQANLTMLAHGRLDGYAELENQADPVIGADPGAYAAIVKCDPPLLDTPYYLMVSKAFYGAHADLAERLWDAIPAVEEDPAYLRLKTGAYAR